jgi:hypothetical protein
VLGSQALGGWQVGSIITAQTGVPFTPTITGDVLGLGSADPWAFPSLVKGCNPINSNFKSAAAPIYYNQQCFAFPQQGSIPDALCNHTFDPNGKVQPFCLNEFGNVKRNSLVGPKLVDVDFSVYKNFPIRKISESFNVQFRAELFNVFNHANFAPPINNVAILQTGTATDSLGNTIINVGSTIPTGGSLDRTTTTSRQIQFGLKVNF